MCCPPFCFAEKRYSSRCTELRPVLKIRLPNQKEPDFNLFFLGLSTYIHDESDGNVKARSEKRIELGVV
jgi:hypothetical protein